MLEDACHELDIKVALALAKQDGEIDSSSFGMHVANLKQAQRLEAEANDLHEVADAHEEQALWLALHTGNDACEAVTFLREKISHLRKEAESKV